MQAAGERADKLSLFATYFGDPRLLNEQVARYRSVKAEDVNAFARERLGADNRASLLYVPRNADAETSEWTLWQRAAHDHRSSPTTTDSRPDAGLSIPGVRAPNARQGLAVIVAPVAKLPVVTVMRWSMPAPPPTPAARKASLNSRRTCWRGNGTERRCGAHRAVRAARHRARHERRLGRSTIRITVTPQRLPEALALVAEVILTPSFSEREVERLKQERLTELLQQQAEPRGLADDMFGRFAYAPTRVMRFPTVAWSRPWPRSTVTRSARSIARVMHRAARR